MSKRYKIVVHVPPESAEVVRTALDEAGAGHAGDYTQCSFTYRGTGRFKPGANAQPHIGTPGQFSEIPEDSVEVSLIDEELMPQVLAALYKAHPYEEPAIEIIELVDPERFFPKKLKDPNL